MPSIIAGIVLAAGGSRRLNRPKQLLEFNGETLVHATVRAAFEGGCEAVCVVTGHSREAVESAVSDLHPLLAHNDSWERGMGSSLRVGLRAVSSLPSPLAAIVLLACDQPAVTGPVIQALISTRETTGCAIVASQYSGTLGIPALFNESCFAELRALPDERGAKALIEADPKRVFPYNFPNGALDLDTPEDVQRWQTLALDFA